MSALIEIQHVKKVYSQMDRQDLTVLQGINFDLFSGEIVALLGTSGSGKSTLLRVIAGLTQPTAGQVIYGQQRINRPMPGMSMVFQNFSLLPWLTVLKNVELGLLSKDMPKALRREKALKIIDIVGMDGFESAYPRELSGGMCQRVGIARALVAEPEVLLMDEPFSSLDVLTADNLRSDLLDLWASGKTNLKSIFIVTHNVEEAALMADRVLIMSQGIAGISNDFKVTLSQPRQQEDRKFKKLVERIYGHLSETSRLAGLGVPKSIPIYYRLPKISVSEMSGLLETLVNFEDGKAINLARLAEEGHLEGDDLFNLLDVLIIMRFVELNKGVVALTYVGRQFAKSEVLDQKKIFAAQLLDHVPLARKIRKTLDQEGTHRIHQQHFLELIVGELGEAQADEVLKVVISWGRYAELFAYNVNQGMLSLDNPE